MKYAKIIVKNNYEQRGDLVLRNYVRALRKLRATNFLDGRNALIYGIVDDNGEFYEMLTREKIDYDDYVLIDQEEYLKAFSSKSDLYSVIFVCNPFQNKDINLNMVISTVEDLAGDNMEEFNAYCDFYSRINPYQRLSEEKLNAYNECNNFHRKLEEIKIMKRLDSYPVEFDEYEVLENPKRLVRK